MTAIDRFLGLDLRPGDRSLGALALADNLLVDTGGSLVRRPALVRRATLPAGTAGLYVHDDTLRAVAPEGTSTAGLFPTMYLDYLPATSLAGRVQAARLASGRRALWVESVNGGLGGIGLTVVDAATAGGSMMALSFSPVGLLGLGGRLLTMDPETSRLRWSGQDSPDDNDGKGWVDSWDPAAADERAKGGYVSLAQGSSEPRALAEYRGDAAVFLRGAVMLFSIGGTGVDSLEDTVGGPGTRHPGTVQAVSGDLIYLDPGSRFRSLSTDRSSVLPAESTLGDPIASLVRDLIPAAAAGSITEPEWGIYARSLGIYLAGWRNEAVALTVTPGEAPRGWSRWTFPAGMVITGAAECRGTVYLRSSTGLWSLEANAPDDEVADGDHRPVPITMQPTPLTRSIHPLTSRGAGVVVQGTADLRMVVDGAALSAQAITGAAPAPCRRLGFWRGRSLSLRLTNAAAPADWRCDACEIDTGGRT